MYDVLSLILSVVSDIFFFGMSAIFTEAVMSRACYDVKA